MATKRITVLVDEDMFIRLNTEIRHGFRGPLIAGVLKMVLNGIKDEGDAMIGALIAGKYKLVPDYEDAK